MAKMNERIWCRGKIAILQEIKKSEIILKEVAKKYDISMKSNYTSCMNCKSTVLFKLPRRPPQNANHRMYAGDPESRGYGSGI